MAKKQTDKFNKKLQTRNLRRSKPVTKRPNKRTTTKISGIYLAVAVLAKSKEPMTCKAIAEKAIAAGWQTKGKTPHATLYSAIIREIEKKGKESRFKKVGRGKFVANAKVKA